MTSSPSSRTRRDTRPLRCRLHRRGHRRLVDRRHAGVPSERDRPGRKRERADASAAAGAVAHRQDTRSDRRAARAARLQDRHASPPAARVPPAPSRARPTLHSRKRAPRSTSSSHPAARRQVSSSRSRQRRRSGRRSARRSRPACWSPAPRSSPRELFSPKRVKLYTWRFSVRAGRSIVSLRLPGQVRRPGVYSIRWTARSGRSTVSRKIAIRFVGPKTRLGQPVRVLLAGAGCRRCSRQVLAAAGRRS